MVNKLTKAPTGNEITNKINEIIDDLTLDELNSFHALKSYEDTGELLTNAEGLADVKKYAHSTFDSTNFTATNSAIITSNGIASNWGRVTSPEVIVSTVSTSVTLSASKIFVLEMDWVYKTSAAFETVFATNLYSGSEGNRIIRLGKTSSGDLVMFYPNASGVRLNNSVYSFSNNEKLRIKVIYNPTNLTNNLTLQVTRENGTVISSTGDATMLIDGITTVYFGSNNAGQEGYQGTIDLKYVRITNGNDVISGNKTGIDTIKPDDYAIVGSPTISNDGIASGFSASNYLSITNFSISGSWKIFYQVNFSALTGQNVNPLIQVSSVNRIFVSNAGYLNIYANADNTSTHYTAFGDILININTNYLFEISYDGNTTYTFVCHNLDNGTSQSQSRTLSDHFLTNSSNWFIGSDTSRYLNGSIDLNTFKIYVNGDLVYQPCLKIPYTESSTKYGAKVVAGVYRNRVIDTWEQGYTNRYYVLDEENGKFSLPCGDVYGLIAQATSQGGYRNIGEVITSTIPLTDAGLHLLDGSLLQYGSYSDFIDYIASIYSANSNYFCSESDWQASVTAYGVCGKFVYNSTDNTVRLPKITGIVEGASGVANLGDLTQAGLPNITGTAYAGAQGIYNVCNGAFVLDNQSPLPLNGISGVTSYKNSHMNFNASASNSIYGNSSTVQPQTVKVLYYIVIATTANTQIEVDIDEIATDLNGKADVSLSNINTSGKNLITNLSMPDYANQINTGTSGTAPSNGFIQFYGAATANSGSCQITVNSKVAFYVYGIQANISVYAWVPIQKDEPYQINLASVQARRSVFIPCKGV